MKKILFFMLITFLAGCSLTRSVLDFVGEETGYQLDVSSLTQNNQDLDGLRNMQSQSSATSKKH